MKVLPTQMSGSAEGACFVLGVSFATMLTRFAQSGHFFDAVPKLLERRQSSTFPVASYLSIEHVGHVSPFAEELHNFFAGSRQLCPAGLRIRILFQPTNFVPVEHKIHLQQTALGGPTNRVPLGCDND